MKPFLLAPLPGGRPRETDLREVLNALFYQNREGCTWRALPHDFPTWRTIDNYFRDLRDNCTWEVIRDQLRHELRLAEVRPAPASAIWTARPSTARRKAGNAATTGPRN